MAHRRGGSSAGGLINAVGPADKSQIQNPKPQKSELAMSPGFSS